jgi:hypothetical protein
MKTINSLDELLKLVGEKKVEVKLTTYTDPKLKKTNNPFVDVKKIHGKSALCLKGFA